MIRFALVLGVLTGLLVVPIPQVGAEDKEKEAADDHKALQGLWYKLPAADKPNEEPMVLRFHGDRLVVCKLGSKVSSAGNGSFKLREKDGKRLIVQVDFFDEKKETVVAEYSLDGDSLTLSGGPAQIGLAKFDVAGKWKRAK